jgi:hypothetical protein
MKACWEVMEAHLGKMEANQEKIWAIVEHYEGVPRAEAMHLLTTLQVLHEVPKGATYEETTGTTEDQFGDQHLAAGYRNQLETFVLLAFLPISPPYCSCGCETWLLIWKKDTEKCQENI